MHSRITILPRPEYANSEKQLEGEIKDPDDIAYLAAAIATKSEGIWTHDPHFKEQKKVRVFTNIDMLKISGKSTSQRPEEF